MGFEGKMMRKALKMQSLNFSKGRSVGRVVVFHDNALRNYGCTPKLLNSSKSIRQLRSTNFSQPFSNLFMLSTII